MSAVKARMLMERRIVRATVKDLLDAGYLVQASHERGYDDVHKPSYSLLEIMRNLMVCDAEWLMVYDPRQLTKRSTKASAAVTLVYGNGWDVVSDYYMSLEPALRKSIALAERLGG